MHGLRRKRPAALGQGRRPEREGVWRLPRHGPDSPDEDHQVGVLKGWVRMFGTEEPQGMESWSSWGVAAVCAALGALAVKIWPLLMKSSAQRALIRLRQKKVDAEMDRAAAEQEAEAKLASDTTQAKIRRDAHEQVREEYQEFFQRQRDEMQSLRKDRDDLNDRMNKVFEEMRAIDRAHSDCMVKNEKLIARVNVLAQTIENIRYSHWYGGMPTRNEAVIVADEYGVIREWSPACTAMFHWKSWEAIGRKVDLIIPAEIRDAHWRGYGDVLASQREANPGPYLLEAVTKDGAKIPVEITLSSWIDQTDGKRMFTASIRQRPVDAAGKTAEDLVDVDLLTASPLPTGDTLSAIRRAEAAAQADPGAVQASPEPSGGMNLHVPAGATASVKQDGVVVEVKPKDGSTEPK
jgi:PAS domain S-box-containing protein